MEQALCEVCKDIRLGKILIQTNLDTGEPEVGRAGYHGDRSDWWFDGILKIVISESFSMLYTEVHNSLPM